MVFLKLLHNNNIVTLDTPGKMLIKSSSGLYFHSSADLLCAALGSCIGKNLVRYCAQNKINVEMFEQIGVEFEDNKFSIHIHHPSILDKDNIIEIEALIKNCSVAQLLTVDIVITFEKNKVDPDITRKSQPCCGG